MVKNLGILILNKFSININKKYNKLLLYFFSSGSSGSSSISFGILILKISFIYVIDLAIKIIKIIINVKK